MKEYIRYTHNADNPEFASPCYLCKHPEERPIRNKQKCNASECDYLRCYELFADLEDTIENADKVEVHYKPPYKTKYAVVKYTCRKGQPLKVASYYIYGEELKTGELLVCWSWQPSTNFAVLENNFDTEEEAKTRMKELILARKNVKEQL
jgi:hypothetical protein